MQEARTRRLEARLSRAKLALVKRRRVERAAGTRIKWTLGGLCAEWHKLADETIVARTKTVWTHLGMAAEDNYAGECDRRSEQEVEPATTAIEPIDTGGMPGSAGIASPELWDSAKRRVANRRRIVAGAILLREGLGDVPPAKLREAIVKIEAGALRETGETGEG